LFTLTSIFSNYFTSGCHPIIPNVTVDAIEEKLGLYLSNLALGTPIEMNKCVRSIVADVLACQGALIEGWMFL
jgi:hypothetical protein